MEVSAVAAFPLQGPEADNLYRAECIGDNRMKDQPPQAAKIGKSGKKAKDREKEEGRVQFYKKDWQLLLDWGECDTNWEALKGTDKSTKVGTKYPTKRQAFDDLAIYINKHQFKGSTLVKLTWETARNRYHYLGGLYKKAKETINNTGWGLTEIDEAKGIFSLDEKIEKLCPCYERVHSLFDGTPHTDLRGNTFVMSLGEPLVEQVPWAAEQSPHVVDVGDSSDSLQEIPHEVESLVTESDNVEVVMDAQASPLLQPTHMVASQTTLPIPLSPALSHAQEDPVVESPLPALQRAIPSKSKLNVPDSYPNKKRHGNDKGQNLTGAFSSGMESMSVEKAKSNEIKERAHEMRFLSLQADRALWIEVAQKKLALESERISIEKQKVCNEIQSARLEAMLKIVNENKHRSPEELAAILTAFTAILPPLP